MGDSCRIEFSVREKDIESFKRLFKKHICEYEFEEEDLCGGLYSLVNYEANYGYYSEI